MNQNWNYKIIKELVKFVREQRKMNMYAEKRLQLHYTLLREMREDRKSSKQWLKNLKNKKWELLI